MAGNSTAVSSSALRRAEDQPAKGVLRKGKAGVKICRKSSLTTLNCNSVGMLAFQLRGPKSEYFRWRHTEFILCLPF